MVIKKKDLYSKLVNSTYNETMSQFNNEKFEHYSKKILKKLFHN